MMKKRIAFVTGGMGGIGQATCRALHDQGHRVIAGYSRQHDSAKAWQAAECAAGYDFAIAYGDVTQYDACMQMIKDIEAIEGTIDILVNNAGIVRDVTCAKMSAEEWDVVIKTDLYSVFNVTHAVIHGMRDRGFGRIVNVSSINGQRGRVGQVNYAAAKAGIHGFTKSLALEVARKGITVNTISPGYVATEMVTALPEEIQQKILSEIPLGRFATPAEVANLIVFLCDDNTSYITGANIPINGGQYLL